MEKRACLIATVVSGALTVSGCTTNPYTGKREAGRSAIGTGLGSLVGVGIGAFSSSKKDHGKGALIDAAAGTALGDGVDYYMDMQEVRLHGKTRGADVSVTHSGDNVILNMPSNVTFSSSSATLEPAGANTLTDAAMILKEYPKTAASAIGYADSTGGHDLNVRLSQQRTDSVASALIIRGVDASHIHTQSLGPTNPIASNSTTEGKARNRRVEITLSPL